MKRYVEVFWTPWYVFDQKDIFDYSVLSVVIKPPKAALNVLQKLRPESRFLECPSVIDSLKNTFIIQSPFDLNVTIDWPNQVCFTDRFGQEFFEKFILLRTPDAPLNGPPLITLPPKYLFYANESVMMQVSDLPIITSPSSFNTRVIPGAYDIGKWLRPIDWTVEIVKDSKVSLKQNDPLFAIKFFTHNNLPIKLTKVEIDDQLLKKVYCCAGLKKYVPNLKLNEAYEYVKNYLKGTFK